MFENRLYKITEIADKLKISVDTARRILKANSLQKIKGSSFYSGEKLNKTLEA